MNRTVLVIVGVLVVAALGGGVYILLTQKKPTTPTTQSSNPPTSSPTASPTSSPTTTIATNNSILSADSAAQAEASKLRYTSALAKIKEWPLFKQNAVFTGLFMSFTPSLELNSANEIYVFDSPDDTANHFTVSVAQKSGNMLRALVPISDFQGTLQPINQQFWKTNYVDAVQFANDNGGKDFMSQNTVTLVDVQLFRTPAKGFLNWVITYHTKDTTKSLVIKMDASDKKLVQE